jgi:hypothetical protein
MQPIITLFNCAFVKKKEKERKLCASLQQRRLSNMTLNSVFQDVLSKHQLLKLEQYKLEAPKRHYFITELTKSCLFDVMKILQMN